MPQDRDKQRGKAIVVDGETSGHSGGQLAAPRKLTAVACIDCRKRKRKVITNPILAQTGLRRDATLADRSSTTVQRRATIMFSVPDQRIVLHV